MPTVPNNLPISSGAFALAGERRKRRKLLGYVALRRSPQGKWDLTRLFLGNRTNPGDVLLAVAPAAGATVFSSRRSARRARQCTLAHERDRGRPCQIRIARVSYSVEVG